MVSNFLETEMYVPLWPGLAAHAVVCDQQVRLALPHAMLCPWCFPGIQNSDLLVRGAIGLC